MRTRIVVYFAIGFICQLLIIGSIAYLYTLLSAHSADDALKLYAGNFPAFLQDKSILLLVMVTLLVVSMLCYTMARKLSVRRTFRNGVMGLILCDVIVFLLVLFVLL
jgi:ABC-type antimicrobial peptide transport system permease subunit